MSITIAGQVAPPKAASRGYWSGVAVRLMQDRPAMFAAAVIVTIIVGALVAPYIVPMDPFKGSMVRRLKPVGFPGHILGTDELGRDMLSRLIYGGRLSLWVGLMPVLLAFGLGSAIGIMAGYIGGLLNTIVMRIVDVFFAFPSVLLAIALSGILGAGTFNSIVALTVVFTPQIARVAESVTTQIRFRDFVTAARISGATSIFIIRTHIIGNVIGPVFVYASGLISVSMILASGLSFLGLGTKPPEPEWGLMLNTLRTAIYQQPIVAALPGVMIFVTSVAFNVFSDGLRGALEVRR